MRRIMRPSSGPERKDAWWIINACSDYATGYLKTDAPACWPHLPQNVTEWWKRKLFLAVPFRGFPFFFHFWFPKTQAYKSPHSLDGLVGQAMLHSGSLASSLSQFLQLTKGESSAWWRARAFEFVSGLLGSTIIQCLTILVLNTPLCVKWWRQY